MIYARVGKLALIKHQRYVMPISSSAPTEACAGSRPIWAASSATSGDAAEPLPARARARRIGHTSSG